MRKRHGVRELNFRNGILFLAAAWLGFSGSAAAAQTRDVQDAAAGTDVAAHAPAFDVVSIRPSKPGEIKSGAGQTTVDEYRAVGWPLWITIGKAYLPPLFAYRKSNILNAPSWLREDNYDFVGKVTAEDVKEWQKQNEHWGPRVQPKMLQSMLQTALAERFKLVVHPTSVEVPGYALVVGKNGPNWKKLKESTPGEKVPSMAQKIAEDGMVVPYIRGEEPTVTFFHTSMASLAGDMSQMEGVPVEDRTGVKGRYDFKLTKWDSTVDGPGEWDFGALGLKLIPIKVQAEALVIDHIEKPSPN